MNIFIDANVLIAVLQKEYPVYPFASRVMSLAGTKNHSVFTSPLCLAIAFYFLEKKHGAAWAGKIIQGVEQHLQITTCGPEETKMACSNKKIADFEDGLQYYSALASGCTCIVTENTSDFHFAKTEVCTSKDFMEQYVLR
jgi:predicted nucleic acid-binding protein